MRIDTRRWLTGVVVCVAGATACQQSGETPLASELMQEITAPIVFGMTSFLTVDGVREGRIQADTAYMLPDSGKVDLRVMEVIFYDEQGRERATVIGRTGEWYQESNYMVARGEVVLRVHTDSTRLESAEIHYDPEGERIWSDSATVRTLADGTVTRGSAFESDIEFENIVVRDPRGSAGRIF